MTLKIAAATAWSCCFNVKWTNLELSKIYTTILVIIYTTRDAVWEKNFIFYKEKNEY